MVLQRAHRPEPGRPRAGEAAEALAQEIKPTTAEMSAADLALFQKYRTEMIARAKEARDRAVQYRKFYVGCSMLGVDRDGNCHIYAGSNNKELEDQPKLCAERAALKQAADAGCEKVVAMVIVSREVDTDPTVHAPHRTLYPCMSCRNMLRQEPLISPNTILLTINDKTGPGEPTDLYELNSVADVLQTEEETQKTKGASAGQLAA